MAVPPAAVEQVRTAREEFAEIAAEIVVEIADTQRYSKISGDREIIIKSCNLFTFTRIFFFGKERARFLSNFSISKKFTKSVWISGGPFKMVHKFGQCAESVSIEREQPTAISVFAWTRRRTSLGAFGVLNKTFFSKKFGKINFQKEPKRFWTLYQAAKTAGSNSLPRKSLSESLFGESFGASPSLY